MVGQSVGIWSGISSEGEHGGVNITTSHVPLYNKDARRRLRGHGEALHCTATCSAWPLHRGSTAAPATAAALLLHLLLLCTATELDTTMTLDMAALRLRRCKLKGQRGMTAHRGVRQLWITHWRRRGWLRAVDRASACGGEEEGDDGASLLERVPTRPLRGNGTA